MKFRKGLSLLIGCCMMFLSSCGLGGEKEGNMINLTTVYNGKTLDICAPNLRAYLNATETKEQLRILKKYDGVRYDRQKLNFTWEDNGCAEYTVYFSENESFQDAIIYKTDIAELTNVGVFTPNKTYYWKVVGDNGEQSASDQFHVADLPMRVLTVEGAANIRDVGGWETLDGKKIAYGKLYRGGMLNGHNGGPKLTMEGIYTMSERLGIRLELDLRSSSDNSGQNANYFNVEAPYEMLPIGQYDNILSSGSTKSALKRIFELLADESNYPIYYHCNAGADRTGTLTFLINGLLGVSYEDLTRDFETTSFSVCGKRWRGAGTGGDFAEDDLVMLDDPTVNYVAWGKLHKEILDRYGDADRVLSKAIEKFLKEECSISADVLERVKNIMTE